VARLGGPDRGPDRNRSVISVSHTAELSTDFGRAVLALVGSELHRAVFPDCRLSQDSAASTRFSTTHGGAYFARRLMLRRRDCGNWSTPCEIAKAMLSTQGFEAGQRAAYNLGQRVLGCRLSARPLRDRRSARREDLDGATLGPARREHVA
jgi:hypothetical protein